jgi:hypothetical protein
MVAVVPAEVAAAVPAELVDAGLMVDMVRTADTVHLVGAVRVANVV